MISTEAAELEVHLPFAPRPVGKPMRRIMFFFILGFIVVNVRACFDLYRAYIADDESAFTEELVLFGVALGIDVLIVSGFFAILSHVSLLFTAEGIERNMPRFRRKKLARWEDITAVKDYGILGFELACKTRKINIAPDFYQSPEEVRRVLIDRIPSHVDIPTTLHNRR